MNQRLEVCSQSEYKRFKNDIETRQYTTFPTHLKESDFQELIRYFKAVIHPDLGYPLQKLELLNGKDRPDHRNKSEHGWYIRKPDGERNESKLFMHYNDLYATREENQHLFREGPEELRQFNSKAGEIYDEVTRLTKHFLQLLEENGHAGLARYFISENERLSLARLRILHYRPHEAALKSYDNAHVYHAEPHYDDSGFTYALYRERPGLRIGTEHALQEVDYSEQEAIWFAAYGLQKFMDDASAFKLHVPAGYHDAVVPKGKNEECTSIVSFIGSDAIPEHRSDQVHPQKNLEHKGARPKMWPGEAA